MRPIELRHRLTLQLLQADRPLTVSRLARDAGVADSQVQTVTEWLEPAARQAAADRLRALDVERR